MISEVPHHMDYERSELGVRAAETTLLVLETIAFAEEALGVTQIASRLGLSKGAVFRHLHGLAERGYVVQDPVTSRYRLGVKASLIGRLAPPASDLAAAAEVPMREARDATSITTVLTAPTTSGALVLSTIVGFRTIEIGVRQGSQLAFHASAQGKIMVAFGPPPLMARALRSPLAALTAHTITEPERLKSEISRVKSQGYATAPEEALLGINAIAAPIFNMRQELIGAVALCGSIQHLAHQPEPDLIEATRTMANRISRNLGHGLTPWDHSVLRAG